MRTNIFAVGLIMVMGLGSLGCKTASQMAWWKTADNAAADSTALAHSAPALPSDVARQAESFVSTEVNITTEPQRGGGVVGPFVPGAAQTPASPAMASAAPSAYPSTGGSNAGNPTSVAAGSVPAAAPPLAAAISESAANLGSVAMPYNPNAVPAARAPAIAPPAQGRTTLDRYAASTSDPGVAPNFTPAPASAPLATTYPNNANPQQASASSAPAVNAVSGQAGPRRQLGDSISRNVAPNAVAAALPPEIESGRYGNPADTTAPVASVLAQTGPLTPTTPPGPEPYRPGGTGDYPGHAAIEIASRQVAPTLIDQSGTDESGAANYSAPGEAIPAQPSRYSQPAPSSQPPRYR